MGIFDFFKKKTEVKELEKLEFNKLNSYIEKEKEKIEKSDKKGTEQIKENLKILYREFEKEVEALKNVNLDKRKEDEKIKKIVLENAKTFAEHLERLSKNLQEAEDSKLSSLASKINLLFQEFKKKAYMSMEKARFLIGKEIADVNRSIDSFYDALNEILEENKKIIESGGTIEKIESLLIEINNIKEAENAIKQEIADIDKILKNLGNKKEDISKKILWIKESEEHSNRLTRKQNMDKNKQIIQKEVINLRALLDLKNLTRIWHSNEKKMKLIKEIEENTLEEIKRDRDRVLDIATDHKDKIEEKINYILDMEKEIEQFYTEKDEIRDLEEEIKANHIEIRELEDKRSKIENKTIQAKDKIYNIMGWIDKELEKTGIKLV